VLVRLLVLDENMWPRLATVELLGRGRAAVALKHTELLGKADPEVIATVAGWTDVVLVTNDDNMPSEHHRLLSRSRLTLAVVAPRSTASSRCKLGSGKQSIGGFI
jgi:predicted nuclease of predicted toxin-antitoxin system